MARIIYGVAGEGFGHSSRSHLIGEYLIKRGHDVMFAASRKSLSYLSKYFPERVKPIFGLSIMYRKGNVDALKTIATNIARYAKARAANIKLYREYFKPFKPDIVISDFEPFSAWWAMRNGVPNITLDHQRVLTHCRIEPDYREWVSMMNAALVTKCYYSAPVRHLILNFFRAPLTSKRAILAGPVVRPMVERLSPSDGEHIVVYTTDRSARRTLFETLSSFEDHKFYVYGYDCDHVCRNIVLKKTSTEGFLADLASSRGVVATAGFSLISECLHLRKRMLLMPVPGQYEQILNAAYMEKLGMGTAMKGIVREKFASFLQSIDEPVPVDNPDILWPDNEAVFRTLDGLLAEFGSEKVNAESAAS